MMTLWLWILLGINVGVWGVSIYRLYRRAHVFQETPALWWLGIFVWGDAALLAPYWIAAAGISLWYQNTLLFWLSLCVFWLIRSTGEMIYWLNQQFSATVRDPKEKFWHYRWFGEAVWFVNQVIHQVIMMVCLIGIILITGQLWHQ